MKENKKSDSDFNVEKAFKNDIEKMGGMENVMDLCEEWDNSMLRVLQLSPIPDCLKSLESQGLIRRHSKKRCLCDYELAEDGKDQIKRYQERMRLR